MAAAAPQADTASDTAVPTDPEAAEPGSEASGASTSLLPLAPGSYLGREPAIHWQVSSPVGPGFRVAMEATATGTPGLPGRPGLAAVASPSSPLASDPQASESAFPVVKAL